MRTFSFPRRRWLAAVTATSVLAVAACSDDGDDERARIEVVDADTAAPDVTDPPDGTDGTGSPDAAGNTPSDDDPGSLLLIMDASGSMNSRDDNGDRLIDSARQALHNLLAELDADQHVGLRVYGHSHPSTADPADACGDTELIHPVSPLDRDALADAIDSFDASGYTPIARSLAEGVDDLPPEGPRTMVLVSDGQETCEDEYGTDPCSVVQNLEDAGIDLVVHTVGFALDEASPNEAAQARTELGCIAEAGGGAFVEAGDASELTEALEDVSVRERRQIEMTGSELEGALTPRDAPTGAVNTWYTDTVLDGETNHYRFEITPGSEVRAHAIMTGNHNGDCGRFHWFTPGVSLVDAGTVPVRDARDGSTEAAAGGTMDTDLPMVNGADPLNRTLLTSAVVADTDEVFVRLHVSDDCDGDIPFDVELQVEVVG
jgi:hypothetical protein